MVCRERTPTEDDVHNRMVVDSGPSVVENCSCHLRGFRHFPHLDLNTSEQVVDHTVFYVLEMSRILGPASIFRNPGMTSIPKGGLTFSERRV